MSHTPLDNGAKHLMRLVKKDRKEDGWATVSATVWPVVDTLPVELVEREQFPDGSGRARLTTAGETVLQWT
jgi:hypothetical protein